MIKFTQGSVTTMEGITKDIVVKVATPNKVRDILIGGGLVLVGVAYLTSTAFKNGAKAFELAEFNTMTDLGIIEG